MVNLPSSGHLRSLMASFPILALLLFFSEEILAFTTTAQIRQQRPSKSCLMPLQVLARNGIEWDDEISGQGRRILPGDRVFCYYKGSFENSASTTQKKSSGNPLDFFAKSTSGSTTDVTVFDQVSTFYKHFSIWFLIPLL